MRKFAQVTNAPAPSPAPKQPPRPRPPMRGDPSALQLLHQTQIRCPCSLQPEQSLMRHQLFKWLVAKCRLTLELRTNTVQHAMMLFDRYVSMRGSFPQSLDQAQLYLLVCLFISSKYHEIYPPSITDFEYVSKYKYLARDLIALEPHILQTVGYGLNFALVSDWVYALCAKPSPEWVLVCLANVGPGHSARKLAEVVVGALGDGDRLGAMDGDALRQYFLDQLD